MNARPPAAPALDAGAAVLDALLVIAFAIAGRSSHAEGLDVPGVWGTALPFLVGTGAGWLASLAWRRPAAVWPTGVVVWAGALVIGMTLRALSGQGTALPFVVVASVTLAAFLVGWRAIAALVLALRRRRATATAR